MKVDASYLGEPELEFNGHFLHADKKTGLAEYGPYGRTDSALHPAQIRVGIVGTRASAEMAERWIDDCRSPIETDKSTKRQRVHFRPDELFDEDMVVDALLKGLSPDFIGISRDTSFACEVITSDRWRSTFSDREARSIADLESDIQRVGRATDLLADHVERVATSAPHPDIILVAIPEILHKGSTVAHVADQRWLNLRRGLKARSMKWGVPIQIVWEDVLSGKRQNLQDKATRAWNFVSALYYKGGGIPWRAHGLETDTCYIGISFYQAENSTGRMVMRSGVAQAFDYMGQGVVLRGEPFEWDPEENGKNPHLTRESAARLTTQALEAYKKISRLPPKRVVVHKTSRFWGEEHPTFDERAGFFEGVEAVNQDASVDLVALDRSRIRLMPGGQYPPARGTLIVPVGGRPIVYTHGFTPYFNTYPGIHVPEPLTISENYGDSDVMVLARELMSLTKMNVNNADFSDAIPITIGFAQKVGEILKEIGPDMPVRSEYAFYM
jgi:hypothetical protein